MIISPKNGDMVMMALMLAYEVIRYALSRKKSARRKGA